MLTKSIQIEVKTHSYCDICGRTDNSPKAHVKCETDQVVSKERIPTAIDICNTCAGFIHSVTSAK